MINNQYVKHIRIFELENVECKTKAFLKIDVNSDTISIVNNLFQTFRFLSVMLTETFSGISARQRTTKTRQ